MESELTDRERQIVARALAHRKNALERRMIRMEWESESELDACKDELQIVDYLLVRFND